MYSSTFSDENPAISTYRLKRIPPNLSDSSGREVIITIAPFKIFPLMSFEHNAATGISRLTSLGCCSSKFPAM